MEGGGAIAGEVPSADGLESTSIIWVIVGGQLPLAFWHHQPHFQVVNIEEEKLLKVEEQEQEMSYQLQRMDLNQECPSSGWLWGHLHLAFWHHQPHFHVANLEGEQELNYSVNLAALEFGPDKSFW